MFAFGVRFRIVTCCHLDCIMLSQKRHLTEVTADVNDATRTDIDVTFQSIVLTQKIVGY